MSSAADYAPPKAVGQRVYELCHRLAVMCGGAVLLVSPWLFASWEMWWFWTMVSVLTLSCLFCGAGLLMETVAGISIGPIRKVPPRIFGIMALCVPFLAYALIRAQYPSAPGMPAVAMETERSLLLFFTPAALFLVFLYSSRYRERALLLRLLLVNMGLLAVCGLINHILTNDESILWVGANDFNYVGRLSAPFYCPNHFSAYANIFLCLLVGTMFVPGISRRVVFACLAGAVLLCIPNFLTLSRGGIASLIGGMAIGIPLFAFRGWGALRRTLALVLTLALVATAFLAIRYTENPLMNRMKAHPLWVAWEKSESFSEVAERFSDTFWYSFDRGTYIGSAVRAWRSNPVWGIGPGQHSNRWAQFAATEDGVRPVNGDPKTIRWPRLRNDTYHLYEVHSDWTQLLEEYGVVGFCLFLLPYFGLFALLYRRQGALLQETAGDPLERALPLAGLLMLVIYTIHSGFDFSLQMPCIVWLFCFLMLSALLAEGERA